MGARGLDAAPAAADRRHDAQRARVLEDQLAEGHAIEGGPQRELVGGRRGGLAQPDLGRQVGRGPEDQSLAGLDGGGALETRQPEVAKDRRVAPPHQDVLGLHVPVDHAAPVQGGQGVGELRPPARHARRLEGVHPAQQGGEVLAVHVLVGDPDEALRLGAVGQDADDVGVGDLRGQAGLSPEAPHRVGLPLRRLQDLQGHQPGLAAILDQEDPPEASPPQQAPHPEAPLERGGDRQVRVVVRGHGLRDRRRRAAPWPPEPPRPRR